MKSKPGAIPVAFLILIVLAWSIYDSGSPDREVAGLIDAKPGTLSDNQITAELMRRIPPGSTQESALDYLYRHGVDRFQLESLPHQPPGGHFFILIRNRSYIPNPIIRSNEYFLVVKIDSQGRTSHIPLSHRWDPLGYHSGA